MLFGLTSAKVNTPEGMAAAARSEAESSTRLLTLFRRALGREPTLRELDLALDFLQSGSLEQYAQALLSTNEEIFWP